MRLRRVLIVLALALVVSFGFGQTTSSDFPPEALLQRISAAGLRAHMAFLADDLLEGRGTGTRGYRLAANYVRAQFEEMGLRPAGVSGSYFQNVRFRQIDLLTDKSSLTLEHDGSTRTLILDKDYVMGGNPLSTDMRVEGPVVFVGFGVSAPEFGYDDYAGIDVRGKIVAALSGAPSRLPSAPGAHFSSSEQKLRVAAEHGAIGFLSIWAGKPEQRTPFAEYVRFSRGPELRWLDETGVPNDAQPTIRGYARINSSTAAALFEGAPKSWKDALRAAENSQPQAFPLATGVSMHAVSRYSELESPNVAAVLPGSDPQLKNEYVVFTAHLDHLGIGEPVKGDSIYNGAADNASGVAALLEMARAFSEMKTAPRRSLLFLAVTGEEEGLLGSDYYAHNPTVPMAQIVADINMDEVSFLYDFKDIVPLGGEHSSLGAVADDVARHMGLAVSPDPMPEEVYFIRSDQYSFILQGVPALYIEEGLQTVNPDLDGKKMQFDWETQRYHQPSDDMSQPFDFNATVKCTRVDLAVGYEIAQQTERPHWNAGDFFGKFTKH
ncbi:MAG: M28 family metallopeptidase [Terriglobales bacterium]